MASDKSLAAEIEAVLIARVKVIRIRGQRVRFIEDVPSLAAEIAALQSRAFEDGARWMRERAEGVAREWMDFTGCRADENTDGLNPETRMYARGHYHARSAIAAGIAALPLQPEGERSDA